MKNNYAEGAKKAWITRRKNGNEAPWNVGLKLNRLSKKHRIKIGEGVLKSKKYWKGVRSKKRSEKLRLSQLGDKNRMANFETRAKMAESKKGSVPWNKGVKGMKYPNRKSPPPFTTEHRAKLSGRFGKKSPAWKGGKTKLQQLIRSSQKYADWRTAVFVRDGYKCINGHKSKYVNADHKKPFSILLDKNNIKTLEQAIVCEALWDAENGQTLCEPCHKETKTYGGGSHLKHLRH